MIQKHQIKVLDVEDRKQLAKCFRVFSFLRPHLNEAEFVRRVGWAFKPRRHTRLPTSSWMVKLLQPPDIVSRTFLRGAGCSI